ncbi:type II toxin-antitoxin system HicB family antitoxin [Tepidimonas aquatica]
MARQRVVFEGKVERINITLPSRLPARVGEYARAHHMTCSGFLAGVAGPL